MRSAKLIMERLGDITGGTPCVLVGDLNAGVRGDGYFCLKTGVGGVTRAFITASLTAAGLYLYGPGWLRNTIVSLRNNPQLPLLCQAACWGCNLSHALCRKHVRPSAVYLHSSLISMLF